MIVNEIFIATNEPNSYGPAFTTIRIVFELLTAFILIAFRSESRKNMFATIMAAGIAGTSMFMAFQAITTFEQISRNAEFAFPLFTILICLLFMFNGGNAAQVFHPFHPAFRVAWSWLWPWGKK